MSTNSYGANGLNACGVENAVRVFGGMGRSAMGTRLCDRKSFHPKNKTSA
ncbi:MAG: hypothetical protein AAFU84_04990 [Cyanobacteria bacterium J06633_23]